MQRKLGDQGAHDPAAYPNTPIAPDAIGMRGAFAGSRLPSLSSFLLQVLLRRIIRTGHLQVQTNTLTFSVGTAEMAPVRVRVVGRGAEWKLLLSADLALGELFVEGRLLMLSGSICELLDLIGRNVGTDRPSFAVGLYHRFSNLIVATNSATRARRQVAHHYDLDERFYALFLDEDRQYSCAYFDGSSSLDQAQLAKKRHIAAKLLVRPGHRVCDIGCGWGGLAFYIAEQFGASVTGITLSKAQFEVAKKRAQQLALHQRVDFRLLDYRELTDRFERIVSVGMFEHVGHKSYGRFFGKIAQVLTDDGVMLLHSIGRVDGPCATNRWIKKYIFPGGYIPALSELFPVIERAGLIVNDVEVLRLHYAETLKNWRERFLARRREVERLYDEHFCRIWEFYLAASECGFRYLGLAVFQIQLTKRIDVVPLTRSYIGEREEALRVTDSHREGIGQSEVA